MSHNLENNKIFAAILVAGIIAGLAGFVARHLVHPHELEKSVLEIDTSALEDANAGGITAPAGPEPILALLAQADVARGQALSKACLACHSFDKGGPNKIGPNLWGIVNERKAHIKDFAYSDVIKEMAVKGDHWGYRNLNGFLWKPNTYAKGTKMVYPGLKKAEDRASVIAYLRTLADNPAALPTEEEIAAEAPIEEDVQPEESNPEATAPKNPASEAEAAKHNGTPDSKNPENSGNKGSVPTAPATQVPGDAGELAPAPNPATATQD